MKNKLFLSSDEDKMRILIRHADKAYDNGKSTTLIHDPEITEVGRLRARLLAQRLIDTFGPPKAIVCSPYRRCRQTAIEMLNILKNKVKIYCDITLSEYLGNRTNEVLDVESMTASLGPPHPENITQMEMRVRYHNDIMAPFDETPEPIWYISHGIIIHRLIMILGYRLQRNLPYLATYCVRRNIKNTIVSSFLQVEEDSSALRALPRRNKNN